jgi:hypothetical protein
VHASKPLSIEFIADRCATPIRTDSDYGCRFCCCLFVLLLLDCGCPSLSIEFNQNVYEWDSACHGR